MSIGSMIGKLFGGGGQRDETVAVEGEEGTAVEHEGYTIVPAPIKEGSQYRTAGRIEREIDGERRVARFIRADNHAGRDAAIEHSLGKARQIINEQGMQLFERDNV